MSSVFHIVPLVLLLFCSLQALKLTSSLNQTLRLGSLVHSTSHSYMHNGSISQGQGQGLFMSKSIEENGISVRIVTLAGELKGWYSYDDDEVQTIETTDQSPTQNGGALNTNGVTLIPMRRCPPGYFKYEVIHLSLTAVSNVSRFDWDDYDADLPSPCPERVTTKHTTTPPIEPTTTTTITATTTTTTAGILANKGSGWSMQSNGIIYMVSWSTVLGVSYHFNYFSHL